MSATHEPGETELTAAYESLRGDDWPELQALRTSAARYARIRGLAIARSHQDRHAHQAAMSAHHAPAPDESQAPARPAPPPLPHHPPQFDHKRAAAGERDDD